MKNPWVTLSLDGTRKEVLLSHERRQLLPKLDAEKLRDVIHWYGTQEHVRVEARHRLAMLTRAGLNHRRSPGMEQLKQATTK